MSWSGQLNAILTKIIRNAPRNDRHIISQLPPLKVSGQRLTVILARPKDSYDAIWAAYSALTFISEKTDILFLFDGYPDEKDKELISKIFPTSSIDQVKEIASKFTTNHSWTKQFKDHVLTPKLFSLLELSQKRDILYLDSDVLTFKNASEIQRSIINKQGCLLTDSGTWNQDKEIITRSSNLGYKMFSDANTGLMVIPANSLSIDIAKNLLTPAMPLPQSRFIEQSTLSVLCAEAHYEQLPSQSYVVNDTGMIIWNNDLDYKNITVRHFTGNVRHRLRTKGISLLKSALFT